MELELKRSIVPCYDITLNTTLCQEETQEAIVPDAFPDIAEIIAVTGQICLEDSQITEGQVTASGHVEAVVLYRPDQGKRLEKLSLRLPFHSQPVGDQLPSNQQIFIQPSFCHGEARTLNPRKVLVRIDIMVEITCYGPNSLLLCAGVEEADPQGIAQQIVPQTIHPLSIVQQKHFTFDETLTLQGQGELEELLTLRILPSCSESKLIGNKLIFKGETELQLMYLDPQGNLSHSRHQLPFSQVMEVEDVGEGASCAVAIVLESYYLNPSYDGGRSVDLTIDLLAQATVREQRHLSLLQDAYSISHQLSIEKAPHSLVVLAEEVVLPLAVRQIFETSFPIQRVEDSWVNAGKITQTQEGQQLTFGCDLTLSLLCTDETSQLQLVEFTQPISHTVDAAPEMGCFCRCSLPGEVFATVAPGGVEIRLSPQFTYSLMQSQAMQLVATAKLGEARERSSSSVVLRLPQEGESLWDIAKSYGTTTKHILQANQLQEELLPQGQMLLIPSVR